MAANKNTQRERSQIRYANKKQLKKKKSKVKLWIVFLLSLVVIFTALSLTVFFPVTEIKIIGNSIYSAQQIMETSGITVSQNIILLNEDKINQILKKQLPYIRKAEVKKSLSGEVVINVIPEEPFAYKEKEEEYALISKNLKVLEFVSKKPKDLMNIMGIETNNLIIGEQFTPLDNAVKENFETVVEQINNYSFKVTNIDLSNIVDITFTIEDRIIVEIGSIADIESKMSNLNETIKNIGQSQSGVINLKLWSVKNPQAYFRKGDITNYYSSNNEDLFIKELE